MARKYTSQKEALLLMYKFCSYRERSHFELRSKLISIGVYGDHLEEIIAQLVSEGYLNEERFAKAYVSGKFRMKHWGRKKILAGLKKQQISDYAIRKAWAEIDNDEYEKTVLRLLMKKMSFSKKETQFDKNRQAANYVIQKGFEPEIVWEVIKRSIDHQT